MKSKINADVKSQIGLVRQLGLFDSTITMVGIVIGSGIFLTTGIMTKSVPSAGLILLAWFIGGLLTLAGALTYAEINPATCCLRLPLYSQQFKPSNSTNSRNNLKTQGIDFDSGNTLRK
jgi:hypothetical protein